MTVVIWFYLSFCCLLFFIIKIAKFHNDREKARPTHIKKIPSTIDILIALGVPPDHILLRKLGKKVLVVEDSATQRKVIARMLSEQGYRVREASDGLKALELLENEVPDLILLDIIMPGMDGYKLMSAIKEKQYLESVPIIMLTSRDKLIDKMRGKISGTDEYLTKPFKSEELMAKVDKYLGVDSVDSVDSVDKGGDVGMNEAVA